MAAGPGRLRAAGGERPRARRPGPRLPSARPPGRGGCFPRHRSPARSAHTSGGVVEGAWAAPIPRPGIRPPPQDGSRPLFTRGPRAPGRAPPGRGATSWAPAGRLRGVAGSRPSTRGSSEHRAGAGGAVSVLRAPLGRQPGTWSHHRHLRVPRPGAPAGLWQEGRAAARADAGVRGEGGTRGPRPTKARGTGWGGGFACPNLCPNEMKVRFATQTRRTLGNANAISLANAGQTGRIFISN